MNLIARDWTSGLHILMKKFNKYGERMALTSQSGGGITCSRNLVVMEFLVIVFLGWTDCHHTITTKTETREAVLALATLDGYIAF